MIWFGHEMKDFSSSWFECCHPMDESHSTLSRGQIMKGFTSFWIKIILLSSVTSSHLVMKCGLSSMMSISAFKVWFDKFWNGHPYMWSKLNNLKQSRTIEKGLSSSLLYYIIFVWGCVALSNSIPWKANNRMKSDQIPTLAWVDPFESPEFINSTHLDWSKLERE